MFSLIAIYILGFIFLIFFVRWHQKSTKAICVSSTKLDGKVVIVTGGTDGLGLDVSKELARRGAKVYIACPFKDEGNNAQKEIVDETGNQQVYFKLLDLSSIESVRKFAASIITDVDRLDILINNAGIAFQKDYITEDGMSYIMQVNYFGHFLLTLLLLPLLKRTGTQLQPSRILLTGSIIHGLGVYDIKNLNTSDQLFELQTYSKSKYALVVFATELSRRLKESKSHVVINCVDPGVVGGTGILKCTWSFLHSIQSYLCEFLCKSRWEGAQTTLYAALDPEGAVVNGGYFRNCKLSKASSSAFNDDLVKFVWEQSVKLVKISDEELKSSSLLTCSDDVY